MARHGPGTRITFPELEKIIFDLGMSIAQVSRDTKVARNTIAAIIAGDSVKPLTIKKILDGLVAAKYDVSLPLRILSERTQVYVGNGGNGNGGAARPLLATIEGIKTNARLVKDARDQSRSLLRVLDQIAEHTSWAGLDVDRDDLEFLWANLTKLETTASLIKALRFPPALPK